jgi:hypothetical protein
MRIRGKGLPSRIYTYGVKLDGETKGQVREIMFKYHEYKNKLIELERARREKYYALCDEYDADIRPLTESVEQLTEKIGDLVTSIAHIHAEKRTKKCAGEEKKELSKLKGERKQLYATLKEKRAALGKIPEFVCVNKKQSADHLALTKQARKVCGIYWGTYAQVEESCSNIGRGAPPKFRRYEGEGKVAVQLLPGTRRTWGDIVEGRNQYVRMEPVPRRSDGLMGDFVCRLRVGSKDRQPVWLSFGARLHRPVPDDSQVLFVWLLAKRIGSHIKYALQFTLGKAVWPGLKDRAQEGTVALDLGWRQMDGGDVRVAYWVDDRGQEGQILLPAERVNKVRKVFDLQAIIDKNFNRALAVLGEWKKRRKKEDSLPEWFLERTLNMHLWKSPRRLAKVVWHWRSNRIDGDGQIFSEMEAWRGQYRHLYDWHGYQSKTHGQWRGDFYRQVVAEFRRKYRVAILEQINWAQLMKKPRIEEEDPDKRWMRFNQRAAAVGVLNAEFKCQMAEVVRVNPDKTSQVCAQCKHCNKDMDAKLMQTCPKCGAKFDRDRNACLNLLRLGGIRPGNASAAAL